MIRQITDSQNLLIPLAIAIVILAGVSAASAQPVVTIPAVQTAVEGAFKFFNPGSFTDSGSGPWAVQVHWGDGTATLASAMATGSLPKLSHLYGQEGTYTVTVTVTNAANTSGSAFISVHCFRQ